MKNLSHVIGSWQIAKLGYLHIDIWYPALSITAVAPCLLVYQSDEEWETVWQYVSCMNTVQFMTENSSLV